MCCGLLAEAVWSPIAGLNFSPTNGKVDLPVQLHFALFKGSGGFVLKPPEMCRAEPGNSTDDFWPMPRQTLRCVTAQILSLHNLPKVPLSPFCMARHMMRLL